MSGEIYSRGSWGYRAGRNDKVRKLVVVRWSTGHNEATVSVQLARGGLAGDHNDGVATVGQAS